MPNVDDLTGIGVSAQHSELVGQTVVKVTGAGATVQVGAATITSPGAELNPTGATANSFVLPSTAKVFQFYYLTNPQSTAAIVFVPSGHSLNSVANASLSMAQYASNIFWQYKPKYWTYK